MEQEWSFFIYEVEGKIIHGPNHDASMPLAASSSKLSHYIETRSGIINPMGCFAKAYEFYLQTLV